jgi:hypothetical protein
VNGSRSLRAFATVRATLVFPVPAMPCSQKIASPLGLSAQSWISLRIRHWVPGRQGTSAPNVSAESKMAFPANGSDSKSSASFPVFRGRCICQNLASIFERALVLGHPPALLLV